jgi:hypothetical protein
MTNPGFLISLIGTAINAERALAMHERDYNRQCVLRL